MCIHTKILMKNRIKNLDTCRINISGKTRHSLRNTSWQTLEIRMVFLEIFRFRKIRGVNHEALVAKMAIRGFLMW